MRLGKKLIVFIVGFCLPAIMSVSYCLSMWFDHRVETFKINAVKIELNTIQSQIEKDINQLVLLAKVYALPLSKMAIAQRISLDEAWRDSLLGEHLSLFYLNDGQLQPFSPLYDDVMSFEFDPIPAQLQYATQTLSGVYMLQNKGFIVSLVPVSENKSIVLARQLTPAYLSTYGLKGLVSNINMVQGEASEIADSDNPVSTLAVPSLIFERPVHLEVQFSENAFNPVKLKYDLVTFSIVGIGLLILIIGYIWLKLGLIRPLRHLMTQIADIDPVAKTYTPLVGSGCAELVIMADRVNHLLARIFQQKERFKTTLESIAEAVILTDIVAKVVYLNPQAEQLLGIKSDNAIGTSVDTLLKTEKSIKDELGKFMHSQAQSPRLSKLKLKTDKTRILERSISNLLNHQRVVIGSVIVLRDVTQEEGLKRQLRQKANFDSITSLLNRRAFEERLEPFSHNAQSIAICYFDLEQFKLINDSCGHSAGDTMLAMVAKAMQSCLSKDEMLARLGGDEFGLAIKDHNALEVAQLVKKNHSQCFYASAA